MNEAKHRVAMARAAQALLSADQLTALIGPVPPGHEQPTGAKLVAFLATEAEKRLAETTRTAERRVQLIQDRYTDVLARALSATARPPKAQWFAIDTSELHRCYMAGPIATPSGTWHEKHPGSRKGLIIVDWRKPEDFANRAGEISKEGIRARVRGDPKP